MTTATVEHVARPTFDIATLSRPAQLLLARLLLARGKNPPTPAAISKDLNDLLQQPLSTEQLQALQEELAVGGLVEMTTPPPPKKVKAPKRKKGEPQAPPTPPPPEEPFTPTPILRLSESGKSAALRFLGLTDLPEKLNWKQMIEKHLFPQLTGVSLKPKQKAEVPLLQRKYGLHVPDSATLARALDALVCKELGFEQLSDLKALRAAVLSRHLKLQSEVKPADIDKQFVALDFGLRNASDKLPLAAIRAWASGDGVEPPAHAPRTHTTPTHAAATHTAPTNAAPTHATATHTAPAAAAHAFNLADFAARAVRVARGLPDGRFGDDKVFISRAWRAWQSGGQSPSLDLPAFKQHLIEANRAGLLKLSRADLVAAMDPADVRESETHYLNAQFHFILVQGDLS